MLPEYLALGRAVRKAAHAAQTGFDQSETTAIDREVAQAALFRHTPSSSLYPLSSHPQLCAAHTVLIPHLVSYQAWRERERSLKPWCISSVCAADK